MALTLELRSRIHGAGDLNYVACKAWLAWAPSFVWKVEKV